MIQMAGLPWQKWLDPKESDGTGPLDQLA